MRLEALRMSWIAALAAWLATLACFCQPAAGQEAAPLQSLEPDFQSEIRPLIQTYCRECHAGEQAEAEIDLAAFATMAEVRRKPQVWQKVDEMLDSRQMPPEEAAQPTDAERARLGKWVRDYLTFEARQRAGDPGRVVLRRLSNAEYTYTLRDLTGIDSLDVAREFPVDGAAGEGFTNTGSALVMSPALVGKYLDAAKEVAGHAVLLPDGFRFSPHTTRRDWTDEWLAKVRAFYREFSDDGGGDAVNLQGVVFDTNQGGRLPLSRYLAATLEERDALKSDQKSVDEIARERGLNARYLRMLWTMLAGEPPQTASLLVDGLRARWRAAKAEDVSGLVAEIARWQQALWKFNAVGHIGREGGPQSWMEPANPITGWQEFRLKLPEASGGDVVLYLAADDAGDGNTGDSLVWERPRLVAPGRPDLLLRDVRRVTGELAARRERLLASAAKCLQAAAIAGAAQSPIDVEALAVQQGVDRESLTAWLGYLGIGAEGAVKLGTPITGTIESAAGYDFIRGWVGNDALSVVANSSDQHVRIPGNMKPHSVAVHPTPALSVAVAWRSPAAATLDVEGLVQHAHPECGNGVAWSLDLHRGNTRQRLAAGTSQGATEVPFGPLENIAVRAGDMISLVISPRGEHACDLTAIDLTLRDGSREWNLASDVSPDILAGNPHADAHGNADTWHFYSEPVSGPSGVAIPTGSLLARWQVAESMDEKQRLAKELQDLLQVGAGSLAKDSPDAALYQQLASLGGPLLSAALEAIADGTVETAETNPSPFGLDPAQFGRHPNGAPLDAASLCVQAPSVIEIRLPGDLAAGSEFVAAGVLDTETGAEGSVQLQVSTAEPQRSGVSPDAPLVVMEGSQARSRVEKGFDDFRRLFPAALCYTQIVPVDEAVTLTLFYREDEHLERLMLNAEQAARLDRLWDELHFVSQDALQLVTAFEQIAEFATQDRPDLVEAFKPMRQPINDRADAFRRRLVDTEPRHLDALLEFAPRAFRRPLEGAETRQLRTLYDSLRAQDLSHEEAFRLTLARVLVAPAFLYRIERPGPGRGQGPVTDWELASRLSYFLWSSQPDDELWQLAAAGRLSNPDTLAAQARRMLRDPKVRRLAIEFACQWLHIHGFDHLDEKSERHFPAFSGLRGAMYEESIRFFTELFQNDGSVLSILDADHTFVNEELARHYGIPGVTGLEWRRVDGVQRFSRGGILTQAAILAKQSGASRTSPILRGNWLSEVVLGEKLPRPPKDVPQLADAVPEGLTERQLIERHSSDASCARCHARIDPLGFALEQFDAIGGFRETDAGGLPIDARTTLSDGTTLDGLAGLREYLLTERRDAFLKQFHRKLLGYALGRSVQLSDLPLLAEMHAVSRSPDDRFSSAVELIVRSPQFREIRGREWAYED